MGRKKRDMSYLRPFCYYCDKSFPNEIILHQHQKAKHFTCQRCQKKFSTADSLKSHLSTAHREQLTKIPNAIQGRDSIELKIFGMQGVPRQFVEERILMGAANYWSKVINEKTVQNKKPKELKGKDKPGNLVKDAKFSKNQMQKRDQGKDDNLYDNYATLSNNKPVSITLQLAQKSQVIAKPESRPTMFDREDY